MCAIGSDEQAGGLQGVGVGRTATVLDAEGQPA
jgi:hypothetical protein